MNFDILIDDGGRNALFPEAFAALLGDRENGVVMKRQQR